MDGASYITQQESASPRFVMISRLLHAPVGTRLKYVTRRDAQNWDGHWCVILPMVNLKSAIANFLVDCLLAHPGSIDTRPLDNPGSHLSSSSQDMDSDLSHSDQTPISTRYVTRFLDNLHFIVTTHVGGADISQHP